MDIAFVHPEENQRTALRKAFPRALFASSLQAIKAKNRIAALVVFVDTPVSEAELRTLPSLHYIVTQSTGFDHIDRKACKRRGIQVYNVPDYGTETVAEYTVLLILALLRKFKQGEAVLRSSIRVDIHALHGRDAHGKTLGVIGTGRIGRYVIKLAQAFGMKILAYDPRPDEALARQHGFAYTTLDRLLRASDIITLHVPLLPSTHHLLDSKTLAKTKKGVYVINTARGGLVDTVALAQALDKGHVAGAALDVVEAEDLIAKESDILYKSIPLETVQQAFVGNLLLQRSNVIITPHIAYNTQEALERITEKTIETLRALEQGKADLPNRVV